MIDAISGWVRDLAVMALILAFAEMLLPRNDLRKFARVVIGLVLVAIILGSLVDLSSVEEALATPSIPDLSEAAGGGRHDYAAEGNRIAQAGLEIASRDVRTRLERQVESLARLASGAEAVDARVDLAPSGDLSGIRVVVRVTSARWQTRSPEGERGSDQRQRQGKGGGGGEGEGEGQGQGQGQVHGQEQGNGAGMVADQDAPDGEGVAETVLAARVERAVRDFYGLAGDIPVVVEVRG
ncbi:MAG: stage III sporulation protein AF [Firmicutes bacterium]|nr:stage III sporulation protein AF [Bacillota bacterium]